MEKKYQYILIIRAFAAVLLFLLAMYANTITDAIFIKINEMAEYTGSHNTDVDKWIERLGIHNIFSKHTINRGG